jgi:predicted  nucleic acid-binding Zn-ribbon protein
MTSEFGPEDCIEVGPIFAVGRDNADKGANKCMTQAFKYLLLQLLCVSDSKDDTDAASIEADRRLTTTDLDQRPMWERDGYPDEDTARETVERVNDLLRSVDTEHRAPIRRWLSTHGYPPSRSRCGHPTPPTSKS